MNKDETLAWLAERKAELPADCDFWSDYYGDPAWFRKLIAACEAVLTYEPAPHELYCRACVLQLERALIAKLGGNDD